MLNAEVRLAIIRENQERIALADALTRLKNNSDFQKVYDAFVEKTSREKVSAIANVSLEMRESIFKELYAISYFEAFLASIEQDALSAQYAIREAESNQ